MKLIGRIKELCSLIRRILLSNPISYLRDQLRTIFVVTNSTGVKRELQEFLSKASTILSNEICVDDILSGGHSLDETKSKPSELKQPLNSAGFLGGASRRRCIKVWRFQHR